MLFGKFSGQGLVHSNILWVMQETFTECADLSLIWKQRSHWRHMSNNELQVLCLKFKLYKIMLFKQPWLVKLSESLLDSVYGTSTKFDTLPVDYDVWRRWMNATLHCSCCAVQAHKTLSWPQKLFALNVCNTIFQVFEQNKRSVHNLLSRRRKLKSVWQQGIKNPRLIDLAYGQHLHTHTHICPGTLPAPPPAGQGSALITTMPWLHVCLQHIFRFLDQANCLTMRPKWSAWQIFLSTAGQRAESREQRRRQRQRQRWRRCLWKLLPSKIAT